MLIGTNEIYIPSIILCDRSLHGLLMSVFPSTCELRAHPEGEDRI
jgi:hypothetical protein